VQNADILLLTAISTYQKKYIFRVPNTKNRMFMNGGQDFIPHRSLSVPNFKKLIDENSHLIPISLK